MVYASSASTDVAACEDLPGHHLLAARNLITTTNDESYHVSASELPPTTSHGYAEWDFTGVPDLMMFQRFLQGAGPSAPPTLSVGGADINAQLAQARGLKAKLAEEYRAVRLLRASIAGEASARGERARELGRQARDRINADFNVNNPNTPPRASQKIIAATTLLRAMPAPSTPEAQNLYREAQALIEQATVQQAESSASCIRQQGSA
jgi:hypothetical protein